MYQNAAAILQINECITIILMFDHKSIYRVEIFLWIVLKRPPLAAANCVIPPKYLKIAIEGMNGQNNHFR